MNKVDLIEHPRLRKDIPAFRPGDQVKVHVNVREGQRERIQVFEGVVIARRGGGLRESFTVRKISFNNVGVERTFPLHAPVVAKIEIVRHGRVRRAKLYYLRELKGRQAKINERRTRIPAPLVVEEEIEEIVPELAPEETEEAVEATAESGAEATAPPATDEAAEIPADAPGTEPGTVPASEPSE